MKCRMCDNETDTVASQCTTEAGEIRIICVPCVRGILKTLGIEVQDECDHFHEEDTQAIAAEVEEFFKQ